MALAAALASVSSAAPVTLTVTTFVAPSPSATIMSASWAHTSRTASPKAFRSSVAYCDSATS